MIMHNTLSTTQSDEVHCVIITDRFITKNHHRIMSFNSRRFILSFIFIVFQVKDIILEPEMWSVENNKLTPTFKTKRTELEKEYKSEIDVLYQRLD